MQSVLPTSKRFREILAFLVLCLVVWPLVAATLIGAWGVGSWLHLALTSAPGPR